MKKILLFALLLFLLSCFSQQVREQNLTQPAFEFQKTYLLRQMPVDFMTIYNVWKYYPINFIEFENLKQMQEAKQFRAKQKLTLTGKQFTIEDKENNKNYVLKQKDDKTLADKMMYTIELDGNTIVTINQIDEHDPLIYEFTFKDKTYILEGEIKKFKNDIQGFLFNIKNKSVTLGSFFKQYRYFKNEYEIIINRKYNDINDPLFVCTAIFIDQLLKEKDYYYK